jgi:alpha-galactosidase
MMGSHIASGHSHTTGRIHSLSFRAATAVFGHLGIEWNLAGAGRDELDQLREWIDFFKGRRELLFRGEFVRLDFPDDSVCVNGVVAPDGSGAIYSVASVGRSEVALLGRLRLPGLDPDRRYSVRPQLVGGPPDGLRAPLWWGARQPAPEPYVDPDEQMHSVQPSRVEPPGVVLSGAALNSTGLMAPIIHPEQAVIYLAEAVT